MSLCCGRAFLFWPMSVVAAAMTASIQNILSNQFSVCAHVGLTRSYQNIHTLHIALDFNQLCNVYTLNNEPSTEHYISHARHCMQLQRVNRRDYEPETPANGIRFAHRSFVIIVFTFDQGCHFYLNKENMFNVKIIFLAHKLRWHKCSNDMPLVGK